MRHNRKVSEPDFTLEYQHDDLEAWHTDRSNEDTIILSSCSWSRDAGGPRGSAQAAIGPRRALGDLAGRLAGKVPPGCHSVQRCSLIRSSNRA
jgi:hypothetical protein